MAVRHSERSRGPADQQRELLYEAAREPAELCHLQAAWSVESARAEEDYFIYVLKVRKTDAY